MTKKTKASSLEVVLECIQLLHKFCKCHSAFSLLWVSFDLPISSIRSHVDEDQLACTAAHVSVRLLLLGPAVLIKKKTSLWMSPALAHLQLIGYFCL